MRGLQFYSPQRALSRMRVRDLLGCIFVVTFSVYAVYTILWVIDDIMLTNLDLEGEPNEDSDDQRCPKVGEGPKGMVVTAAVAPGEPLPAVAMRYLGVWALARKEGAMPAFPQFALEILRDAFANLSVVGLEQIVDQCNASYLLQELDAAGPEGNRADLLKKSAYNRKSAQLLVIGEKLLVNELTEAWRSLPAVLTFKRSLKEKARRTLQRAANAIEDKGHHNRVEFIGVLAMPGARNSSSFFSQALAMMRFRLTGLGAPLFVIVCGADDGSWCSANIPGGADVFHASPRADSPLGMALLAACNHSVFAFGANGVGAALRTRDGSNFVYHFGGSLTERRDMLRFVQRVKPPWFQLEF